jgi:hypothetical protein
VSAAFVLTQAPSQAQPSAPAVREILSTATICQGPILTSQRQPDNHRYFTSNLQSSKQSSVLFASREVTWISPSQQRWLFDYSTTPTAHGAQGRQGVSQTLKSHNQISIILLALATYDEPETFEFYLDSRRSIALRRLLSPFTF